MAEPVNATFLALSEAFGTRNQEQLLSELIVPTRDILGDMLANLRLVGADSATTAVIASGATVNPSVRIEQDTYVTGMWIQEPLCTASDSCIMTSAFVLRNQSGAFQQLTPLSMYGRFTLGGGSPSFQRFWPLSGIPWGALLRAGDLLSVNVLNAAGVATVTGCTIGYRGLSGPPG